jgi:hypothetical protein
MAAGKTWWIDYRFVCVLGFFVLVKVQNFFLTFESENDILVKPLR